MAFVIECQQIYSNKKQFFQFSNCNIFYYLLVMSDGPVLVRKLRKLFQTMNLNFFYCELGSYSNYIFHSVLKVPVCDYQKIPGSLQVDQGRVRLGSSRNKNNWNNASKRLFGSYSHSGIPGFHSGYSAPRSRIAGIYSGIHSYSGIFPNKRALESVQLTSTFS